MPCYLLHVLESPEEDPYADPDVKDVVGKVPQFFCTRCAPILRLRPSDGIKCMRREAPCWKPGGQDCPQTP